MRMRGLAPGRAAATSTFVSEAAIWWAGCRLLCLTAGGARAAEIWAAMDEAIVDSGVARYGPRADR